MIIGIDASKLDKDQKTGVEISTSELIQALLELDTQNEYWLYSPVPLSQPWSKFKNVKNIVVPGKKLWTLWHLSRALRRHQPHLFWSPTNFLPYNLPKRSVVTIHDVAFHLYPQEQSLKHRLLNYFTLRRALNSASHFIAVSKQTKSDLKKYFNVPGEDIDVVYHALRNDFKAESKIDVKEKYPKLGEYFIYVGRIELKKNLINVVRAFRLFIDQAKDTKVQLVLGGSPGFGAERINKEIKDLGLQDRVVMLGYIPANHLFDLYKNSLGLVYASSYEGFGLNILEGFASGTPVITSNLGAMAEIGGDGALLVDPDDDSDIASAFIRLSTNPSLRKVLIQKGRARLQDFSWQESARKVIDVWQKIES